MEYLVSTCVCIVKDIIIFVIMCMVCIVSTVSVNILLCVFLCLVNSCVTEYVTVQV